MLSEGGEEKLSLIGEMISLLNEGGGVLPPEVWGIAGEYCYWTGDVERMELYLNEADSGYGSDNRYSALRGLFRGLIRYREDRSKYERVIRDSLFYLREHGEELPPLKEEDMKILSGIGNRGDAGKSVLKIRTLGGFIVEDAEGRLLPFRTRKGRELFAYLLDRREAPVERDELIEVLWPQQSPSNPVAMLHNMIYNIRRELSAYGLEKILSYENRRYILALRDLDSDSGRAERICSLAERGDIEELKDGRELFLRYPGRYLKDIDAQWACERAERFDSSFLKGCRLLGGEGMREMDYGEAELFYENILSLSPYDEEAEACLIRLFGRQRKWNRLKEGYRVFCSLLMTDLGIGPSAELKEAYRAAFGQ